MPNKYVLLTLLAIAVLISGCANKDNNPPVKSELIPTTNLPDGLTYMATHPTNVSIGGSLLNATEGVYRNNGNDFYIQVIENSNPEALLAQYKLDRQKEFKSGYNPLTTISINGHDATQVTDINAVQKQEYTIVWAAGNKMILVTSELADLQTVIALAKAIKS